MTRSWLLVLACIACGTHDSDGSSEHEEEEHEHEARPSVVRLSAAAIERSEIRLEEATQEVLFGGVEVPAEVQLDPDRTAHVSPIFQGQIAEVRASIGDTVAANDVLVVLRSVALGETRAALAAAQAELLVAEENHQRQQELHEAGIGARRNLVAAEGSLAQARARLSGLRSRASVYGRGGRGAQTAIRSPIAGRILARHATVGEVVDPGTTLFEIADLTRVWVMGRVFARDVESAQMGAPATLSLRSVPERNWTGTLDYVAPALDADTRTLPVRMVLDNEDGSLRPGLFGTLRLPGSDTTPALTIAATAVQSIEGEPYVFIPEGEEAFRAVPMRIGRRDHGRVEVLEGLSAGDRYVASGAFVLKSEVMRSEIGDDDD